MIRRTLHLTIIMAATAWARPAPAAEIGPGPGEATAPLGDVPLDVFTYRPAGCTPQGFLVVFHGLNRNADDYRDAARPLADRLCLIVAAPRFDKARFPTWRYQRGGLVHHKELLASDRWTGNLVPQLAEWLRRGEGRDLPYFLLGHSAGSQFLGRVAAYTPNGARRIVLANPSTYVEPSLDVPVPYGFGGLPDAEARLKRYLALPVTVFLGEDDHGTRHLVENAEGRAQGRTRFGRGERTFRAAEAMARAQGWPFNWRLVTVPGVGHDERAMFGSPRAIDALGLAASQ